MALWKSLNKHFIYKHTIFTISTYYSGILRQKTDLLAKRADFHKQALCLMMVIFLIYT